MHGDPGEHVAQRAGAGLPPVTTAIVAVCSGDGLAELFANLKVQGIVTGGQTLNPSTAELLDTVEHVNATEITAREFFERGVPALHSLSRGREHLQLVEDAGYLVYPWTEAMASGRAVLCFLRPDLERFYIAAGLVEEDENPIVRCDLG